MVEENEDALLIDRLPCTTWSSEGILRRRDEVARETPVEVVVNGRRILMATISPHRLREFAIGHLVCEGYVRKADQVDSVEVADRSVNVHLRGRDVKAKVSLVFSSCFSRRPSGIGSIRSKTRFRIDLVQRGIETASSTIHKMTGGVHTCAICRPTDRSNGIEAIVCDDVGRHSALDKAVGSAALKAWPPNRCFVVSSGRGSSEMVAKCLNAGIPLLVCRGAVTTLAVELARRGGLCLVGFARGRRMNVYVNEWRIEHVD